MSPGDYDGRLVQADMTMSQVRYRRALSQAEEVQEITPDTLTGRVSRAWARAWPR